MEMQIEDLVSAIKKDGVQAAQQQADEIIAKAKKDAAAIISDAKEQADALLKKAESDIEILKQSAKTTAEHAKRDAMLFFKKSVEEEFSKLLKADISKTVKEETLAKIIIAAINDDAPSSYLLEVAEITDGLKGELASKLNEGMEIKANPHIRAGFRLTAKDGSGYFDCSDEEIEKLLAPFFP